MSTILNRQAFNRLLEEDLEWLKGQERTLEREHIEAVIQYELDHSDHHRCSLDRQREQR
ncbi:MAG: hypothetical protein V3R83_09625 [Gammaproteobacteria bacterium]